MGTVGVVQLSVHDAPALSEALDWLVARFAKLGGLGCDLLVLPAGLEALFLSPRPTTADGLTDRLIEEAESLRSQAEACAAAVAQRLSVTVVAGPWFVPATDRRVSREAIVVDASGHILGRQRQVCRSAADRGLNLETVASEETIATPAGLVGLLLGADVLFPEPARFLTLAGAEVLIHSPLWPRVSDAERRRGLWSRVQENGRPGAESALLASPWWGGIDDQAVIYAPCHLTPQRDGILASPDPILVREDTLLCVDVPLTDAPNTEAALARLGHAPVRPFPRLLAGVYQHAV